MKFKIIFSFCFALIFNLIVFNSYGQTSPKNINPKSVYLHTDRSYYAGGESIFFKAYILDNSANRLIQTKDTLHVALIDQQGIEVINRSFPLGNSLLSGEIVLPDFLTNGSYMLIASTDVIGNSSPENIFSKVLEVQSPDHSQTKLTLTDSIYKPGSLMTAHVRFPGSKFPVSFSYQLMGPTGELLSGKGKTNEVGSYIFKLQLPEFDSKKPLKLLIYPLYKGYKDVTGIVIPTDPEKLPSKTSGKPEASHLNIQISTLKQVYVPSDKIQLSITVLDENGSPSMANLSVSASNLLTTECPVDYNNILEYSCYKNNQPQPEVSADETVSEDNSGPDSFFSNNIRRYFANSLVRIIETPGSAYVVQEKNNLKKLRKSEVSFAQQKGYSSDRNIMDIIMQIKPYHLDNGKITFGIGTMNSINNQDGALIIVDGVKFGTDAGILSTLPVQDIAHITVSTNLMDIQKYSAMNNVGIIEITMKKSEEFTNSKTISQGNTLYWQPDLIIDKTGKAEIEFLNNNNSGEVKVTVNGITSNGLIGSSSLQYNTK